MRGLDKSESYQTFRRLLGHLWHYWPSFLLGQMGTLVIAVSDGIITYFMKAVLEKGFQERDPGFLRTLPLAVILFFSLRGAATVLSAYCMARVGRGGVREFRCQMAEKIMRLPKRFHDQHASGELLSKINYDAHQVAEAVTEALTSTIRGIFTTISMLVTMFALNVRVTLLLIFTIPLLAYYLNQVSRKLRQLSKKIQSSLGRVTHVASEIVSGHTVIQIYQGEHYERSRFRKAAHKNYKQEMKMMTTGSVSVAVMQFIGAVAFALFLFLATLEPGHVLGTSMSLGAFTSMAMAILGLLRPIKQISVVNSTLQAGLAAARSVFDLLDLPEEDLYRGRPFPQKKAQEGDITFQNVSFQYPDREGPILKNVSFVLPAGKSMALVGRSGSGKSTLAALLAGFYTNYTGQILWAGEDIRSFRLIDWRSQLALVTQETVLFNDTVANNIAYGGQSKATSAEIERAAQLANVLEFSQHLPAGLDTMIGEEGVLLSGGQRQRIAIARALLKNAPILILDEATSALDNESEALVREGLKTLQEGRTTLIIAHRLSTIESADQIVFLEEGQIVERGTHERLLQNPQSYYARLYYSNVQAPFAGS